jgi:hypothetical protein
MLNGERDVADSFFSLGRETAGVPRYVHRAGNMGWW